VTIVLLSAVALLALIVFVFGGVCLEMFRDVRQLRDISGILDKPLHVDIGPVAQTPPSQYGLPPELDSEPSALVLFLSERCGPCRSIAASFDGSVKGLPAGLWIVLEGRSDEVATQFLNSCPLKGMTTDGRVLIDFGGNIARRIGLDTSPVGFRVENGRITAATTIPSSRYLFSILPKPLRLRQTVAGEESDRST
jgi:hypothetical protein